jgi:DNA repair exonuclease SbcCD ATPase subunit/DNA repair exonuclease SbcCD nuclease subunit
MAISIDIGHKNDIHKIIHLSDIHIRTGNKSKSRFDEYMTVFENTFQKVQTLADPHTIIILTGDIFHNKSKIEASGILLFNHLLTQLALICPVVVIQGNHDYCQDQQDIPDLISAMLHEKSISNVFYINETGHYVINDIGFGLVAIKDALKAGDTHGQVDELPDFPDPQSFPEHIKTTVALFHGTINGCTLQNYTKSPSGYPLQWFNGYDIVLLGDVHMRQIHNVTSDGKWITDKQPWGYAGSLVQQNFGESIIDHGFILWNIKTKFTTTVNIKNDIGYFTLKQQDNKWLVSYNKSWIPIADILKKSLCPIRILCRIMGAYDPISLKTTMALYIKSYHVIYENDVDSQQDNADINVNAIQDIVTFNTPQSWIQYLDTNVNKELLKDFNWKQWILDPSTLAISQEQVPQSVEKVTTERNDKLLKQVQAFHEKIDTLIQTRTSITFESISWDWLLCFKDNCWFNFTELNGVASINARNGYGKTSFLEVICLALFGHPISSRYNKSYSAAVICQQKPPKAKSKTILHFKKDGQVFCLHREFSVQSKDMRRLVYNNVWLSDSDGEKIRSGKLAVDKWVEENIGTIDSFLLSGMVSQNADQDFFSMDSNSQLNMLDKSLRIEAINNLSDIFKNTALSYKFVIEHIDTLQSHITSNIEVVEEADFMKSQETFKMLQEDISAHESQYINIPETWHHINISDLQKSQEDIQNTLESLSKISMTTTDSYENLNQKYGALVNKLGSLPKVGKQGDITKIEREMQVVQKRLETFKNITQPQKTRQDYAKFCKDRDQYTLYIKKNYGSIDNLYKKSDTFETLTPLYTLEQVIINLKTLEDERTKLSKPELFDMDDSDFMPYVDTISQKYASLSSDKPNIQEAFDQKKEQFSKSQFQFDAVSKQYEQFVTQSKTQNTVTLEECNEWFILYNSYKGLLDKVRKRLVVNEALIEEYEAFVKDIRDMRVKLSETNSLIDEIIAHDHPYNDACWACKQQSWKKMLVMYENLKTSYENIVYQKEQDLSAFTQKNNITDITKKVKEDTNFLETWMEMCGEFGKWTQYKKDIEDFSRVKEDFDTAQSDFNINQKEFRIEEERYTAFMSEFEQIAKDYDECQYCQVQRPRWKMEFQKNTSEHDIHMKQKEIQQIQTDVQRAKQLEQDEKQWETDLKAIAICEEIKTLTDQLDSYKTEYDAALSWMYQEELESVKKSLEEYKANLTLGDQIAYWKSVGENKPKYEEKIRLKAILEKMKQHEKVIYQQYEQIKQKYQVYVDAMEELDRYKDCMQYLGNLKKAIEHIQSRFIGFRKWLYEEMVIPKLLTETNKIVSLVTNSTNLKLDMTINHDDGQKMSISWFIKDGLNRASIEKASGFQRFMFGITVRIVLSCLGASNVCFKNLFIDEGFTACDSEHLSKVPEFLKNLLNMYNNVVIVSHLEDIKDTADKQIYITREGNLSVIQYGSKYVVNT